MNKICRCGHSLEDHDGGGPGDPHTPTCEVKGCKCSGWEWRTSLAQNWRDKDEGYWIGAVEGLEAAARICDRRAIELKDNLPSRRATYERAAESIREIMSKVESNRWGPAQIDPISKCAKCGQGWWGGEFCPGCDHRSRVSPE